MSDNILLQAVKGGDIGAVKSCLMEIKRKINEQHDKLKAAFVSSCNNGQDEIVKLFISHSIGEFLTDADRKKAFVCAYQRGHDRVVNLLLENCSIDIQSYGKTALVYCCRNGYDKIVDLLLMHKVDINASSSVGSKPGKTTIHLASERGHIRVVDLLIKHGVDINARDFFDTTALMEASNCGHVEIVKTLLENGAKTDMHDESANFTAFQFACDSGHDKVVDLFINRGAYNLNDDHRSFHNACVKGHDKVVNILINCGVDINYREVDGKTPLIYASILGHEYVMEVLLRRGVDVNAQDKSGMTALMHACHEADRHEAEVASTLLEQEDVDADACDINDRTALMFSCAKCSVEITKTLLLHGVNIDAQDAEGMTALLIHALFCKTEDDWRECEDIVSLLLEHNASIDIKDEVGRTAFNAYCKSWNKQLVSFLVENENAKSSGKNVSVDKIVGLDDKIVAQFVKQRPCVNAQADDGKTPVMWAVSENEQDLLKELLDLGVDLEVVHETGRTVFSYAMEGNDDGKCLAMLVSEGRLFYESEGELKTVHNQAYINKLNITLPVLDIALTKRFFKWKWCPESELLDIGLKAMHLGYCPGKVKYSGYTVGISPLMKACIAQRHDLVHDFLHHLYFFIDDFPIVHKNISVGLFADPIYLDDSITSKRLTLQALSFLAVSKAISRGDRPGLRDKRVDTLPLPNLLKDRLKFKEKMKFRWER